MLHFLYPSVIIAFCAPLEFPHFSIILINEIELEHTYKWFNCESWVFRIRQRSSIDWNGQHILCSFNTKLTLPQLTLPSIKQYKCPHILSFVEQISILNGVRWRNCIIYEKLLSIILNLVNLARFSIKS